MKSRFLFYFFPSLLRAVLNVFAIIPLTTYYLDPKDFGVAALVGAITGLAIPLASPGTAWLLSAHYFKLNERGQKQLLFNAVAAGTLFKLFWGIVFSSLAPFVLPLIIKDYWQNPHYLFYFHLSLIATLLNSIWPELSYILILKKKATFHASLEIAQTIVSIATTFVCIALLNLRISTLFISPIVSSLFASTISLWYLRRYMSFPLSKKWFVEMAETSRYNIPVNFIELFANSVDRIFVQRWFNLGQLGIYAHATSYKMVMTIANKAFANTFTPDALQTFAEGKEPVALRRMLAHWFGLLNVAGLFLTLFSREIVTVLTHGKFTAAAPLVPILFFLVYVHSFGLPYTQYLLVIKKNSLLLYSGVVISMVSVGTSALLIWKFNIMGAAVASLLGNLFIHLTRRFYARRLGCSAVADKEFLLSTGLLFTVYMIDAVTHFGLIARAGGFILLSVYVFFQFRLYEPIRNSFERLMSGRALKLP